MRWAVETLDVVDGEIEALPPALQARLLRLLEWSKSSASSSFGSRTSSISTESFGSFGQRQPKELPRGIYVATAGRRVVVLHVFVKKTDKTPRRALEMARKRMKMVMP